MDVRRKDSKAKAVPGNTSKFGNEGGKRRKSVAGEDIYWRMHMRPNKIPLTFLKSFFKILRVYKFY